jgi:hypothetical protein
LAEHRIPNLQLDGRTPEDHAIVSRVFDSKTGELLITAGGITQYGTRAAGEFLTSPDLPAAVARQAPRGWQGQNLQVLLSTTLVSAVPGPPTILAVHFW